MRTFFSSRAVKNCQNARIFPQLPYFRAIRCDNTNIITYGMKHAEEFLIKLKSRSVCEDNMQSALTLHNTYPFFLSTQIAL